jgi:hypothetical protein
VDDDDLFVAYVGLDGEKVSLGLRASCDDGNSLFRRPDKTSRGRGI